MSKTALHSRTNSVVERFSVFTKDTIYAPLHGEDAIGIYVGHEADVDHAQMDKAIEHAREMVVETAKTYGWDEWVQIIIEVVRQDADKAENRTSSG